MRPFWISMAQRAASTTLRKAVAGALDDAAVMGGDGRVDEIAPHRAYARKRPLLVGAGKPAEANNIGD
jgi:hypothetical protein